MSALKPICLSSNLNSECDQTEGNSPRCFSDKEGAFDRTSFGAIIKASEWLGVETTIVDALFHVGKQKHSSHTI
jgi:hypothetical protein